MRRALLTTAALVLAAAVAVAVTTRTTNRKARARVTTACTRLESAQSRIVHKMTPTIAQMVDEADRPAILALFAGRPFGGACAELTRELSDWRWNFGRRFALPPANEADRARVNAAREAMVRAAPRCRNVMTEQLQVLEGLGPIPESERAQLLGLCDFERLQAKMIAPLTSDSPPTLLEDWPRLLESWADATDRL